MRRRTFLKFLGLGIGIGLTSLPIGELYAAEKDEGKAKEPTVEQWMNEWMEAKALHGTLHLSRFVEPIYFLTKSIEWRPNIGQAGFTPVSVPIGFVTDLASIPRVFWSLLRPDGEYTYPAIVHDFLYWDQTRPREVADKILGFGMEDLKVNHATITTIYEAVRLGGQSAWNNNAKLKARGERRILKVFPDDPTIRWSEWKQRDDVF